MEANPITPLLCRFDVDAASEEAAACDEPADILSRKVLLWSRLLSREIVSIDRAGATTVTRVGGETMDDD